MISCWSVVRLWAMSLFFLDPIFFLCKIGGWSTQLLTTHNPMIIFLVLAWDGVEGEQEKINNWRKLGPAVSNMVFISGSSTPPLGGLGKSGQPPRPSVQLSNEWMPRGILRHISDSWLLAWLPAPAVFETNECCQFQGRQGKVGWRAWHNPSPL